MFLSNFAVAKSYDLEIDKRQYELIGNKYKLFVNGSIPGPTLYFEEGETAVINVKNLLDEDTSIHWHGLLLPAPMDGVPGLNGFKGIKPQETFTYKFKIRQSGTYWYHSHSSGQEQDGVYGAIVITPKNKETYRVDRDYVILLSDISKENATQIMDNLKIDSEQYQHVHYTFQDFINDTKTLGFINALQNRFEWWKMGMSSTDLSDVTGYTFLMNGKDEKQNWTGVFKKEENIRLRFINASAMSVFDVRIPGLKMTVISSDGQNVEPVEVDEFRIGNAETYDVIVTPQKEDAYTIVAEPIDRSGFAIGTLATRDGLKGEMPKQRNRSLLTMDDMGMHHNMDGMHHVKMAHDKPHYATPSVKSGWADASTPLGHKALAYSDLKSQSGFIDTKQPDSTLEVRLGGDMAKYIWTINGNQFHSTQPIYIKHGDKVRIKFINETMMAHPMHLHGMFMKLENGQDVRNLPNKHTILVPPGKTISAILTANEVGEWAFHCHMLYHMMAGMMTTVVVSESLNIIKTPIHAH
jgi:CopA family copper-resistance protein